MRAQPPILRTALDATLTMALAVALAGPARAENQPPDRQATQYLLQRLDNAFNRRDPDALLANFQPENQQLYRILSERMRAVLNGRVRLHRQSEILTYMREDSRGVALVRSTTHPVEDSTTAEVEEYSYLVVKLHERRAVGSFAVEVDFGLRDHTVDNQFHCPACNYEVAGAPGWLAVPHKPERTRCMEAISFYYLGADLCLDVSVFVDPKPVPAMQAMEDYLTALAAESGQRVRVAPEAWLPPAHRNDPPTGLQGARADLRLPGRHPTRLYLATLGRLRYLLVLQGDSQALESHGEDATKILDSFRILDPNIPPDQLAVTPIAAHTGGSRFDGNTYINPAYEVRFEGPDGWEPSLQAAGYLFDVTYRCPQDRGTLWVTGYGPQAGMEWRTSAADAWLTNHTQSTGMEILEDSGWEDWDTEAGFQLRKLETTAPRGSSGLPALPRMIRLAMAEDLLLVLHGYGLEQADRDLVQKSFESLRRRD